VAVPSATAIEGVVAGGADSLVAVIVAVPGPTAVTVTVAPLDVLTELAALTVSTAVLLDTQFTVRPTSVLLLASFGTAVSTWVPPTTIGVVGAESVTVATGAGVTVRVALPVFPSLVAVMLAVPALTAVTNPALEIVATAVLSEVHVMTRPGNTPPLASNVVAVACDVSTAVMELGTRATVTEATGAGVTVIEDVPLFPSLVAVIVAEPTA
jgi:hypothetical protein